MMAQAANLCRADAGVLGNAGQCIFKRFLQTLFQVRQDFLLKNKRSATRHEVQYTPPKCVPFFELDYTIEIEEKKLF